MATIISIVSLISLLGLVAVQRLAWRSRGGENWSIGILQDRRTGYDPDLQLSTFPTPRASNLPPSQAIAIGAALVVGLLSTRPMADWFQIRSPPDTVHQAQYAREVDFGDQVRLLALDLPNSRLTTSAKSSLPVVRAKAGGALPVVLYWRALTPLTNDYSVFAHLDSRDGQTYVSADELSPEDIPTSHWPPSLYLRNPLTLSLPSDLPPVRYTLTAGLYDPRSGARLPVTRCGDCLLTGDSLDTWPLALVWVSSAAPVGEEDIPHRLDYRLGDEIALLGYELGAAEPVALTLYWRILDSVEVGYTVFIHVLDSEGKVIAQFDGPPVNGLYPTDAWLPGQIIADSHSVMLPSSTASLVVGLYDPKSMLRLPAADERGERVPNDAIRLQVVW